MNKRVFLFVVVVVFNIFYAFVAWELIQRQHGKRLREEVKRIIVWASRVRR